MGRLSWSMATGEPCMSTPELLLRYLRERMRVLLFLPLAMVMAFVGQLLVPDAELRVVPFLTATAEAFVLSFVFRLWDDLEDRTAARTPHPQRAMAASPRTVPFVVLGICLATFAIAGLVRMDQPLQRVIAL